MRMRVFPRMRCECAQFRACECAHFYFRLYKCARHERTYAYPVLCKTRLFTLAARTIHQRNTTAAPAWAQHNILSKVCPSVGTSMIKITRSSYLNNGNLYTVRTASVYWDTPLGRHSLSGKTSYRKISWSLEAARFGFKLFQLLWNLAGTSAAVPPRCLSNFRAIRLLQHPISQLRDFTRFGGKTSYRLVNRGPGSVCKGIPT